jgi:hypothetical protein
MKKVGLLLVLLMLLAVVVPALAQDETIVDEKPPSDELPSPVRLATDFKEVYYHTPPGVTITTISDEDPSFETRYNNTFLDEADGACGYFTGTADIPDTCGLTAFWADDEYAKLEDLDDETGDFNRAFVGWLTSSLDLDNWIHRVKQKVAVGIINWWEISSPCYEYGAYTYACVSGVIDDSTTRKEVAITMDNWTEEGPTYQGVTHFKFDQFNVPYYLDVNDTPGFSSAAAGPGLTCEGWSAGTGAYIPAGACGNARLDPTEYINKLATEDEGHENDDYDLRPEGAIAVYINRGGADEGGGIRVRFRRDGTSTWDSCTMWETNEYCEIEPGLESWQNYDNVMIKNVDVTKEAVISSFRVDMDIWQPEP